MLLSALLSNPLFYPIAFVISVTGWVVYQRVFSPYAKIPGPFWASITRFWYLNRIIEEDMHQYTKQLHKKYGMSRHHEKRGFDSPARLTS
jgi:hypothetical protein